MGELMPELLEHLDSRGLPPEMLMCDFMMSLGCRALPPTSLLRCFDLLFWEGRDTLQYMALAVLRHAEVSTLSPLTVNLRIFGVTLVSIPPALQSSYDRNCRKASHKACVQRGIPSHQHPRPTVVFCCR